MACFSLSSVDAGIPLVVNIGMSAQVREGGFLFCLLRELKLRPIAAGVLSNLPGLFAWWDRRRPMGNTSSSAYARGVWRLHLENYATFSGQRLPAAVAEFGPGATLGACIAAICDGVGKAVALDVCPYASDDAANLRVLDELLPDSERTHEYVRLKDAVTRVGTAGPDSLLRYVAPCTDPETLSPNSMDFIFSHSVMEHVSEPQCAYEAFFRWLRPGGIISHKIDHSSHAITRSWNGHYGIPDALWSVIVGRRPYLLNRMTPTEHRDAIVSAGFRVLLEKFETAKVTDSNSTCPCVKNTNDYQIKTSMFVCQKPSTEL